MTTTPWRKAICFFTVFCLAYGFLCPGALRRVYGVLGLLAPVHRCARLVCGVVCAASWASWLLFTDARARCVLLACFLSPSLILACSSACPPALSCRRLLVLVAPLALAFESPSVLVRSFGLSFSSFPWLLSSLSSLPTSPCSCLSFPPSCLFRSGPSGPGSMCPCAHVPIRLPFFSFSPLALSPPASRLLSLLSSCFCSLLLFLFSSPCRSAAVSFSLSAAPDLPFPGCFVPGRSSPGVLCPRMFHFAAPGAPPDFLPYSLCCPGRSSPWHWVYPRTIQSGGSGRASFRPGCPDPGRLFVLFVLLPRTLHPMAPGSPLDDPFSGLVSCLVPSRMLHSGAPFNRILSFALDAPVRSTRFSPGRSSLGARAVLHSAPDAPLLGVFLAYSLRCLGRSSPWRRVHPRTIQSGGLCRASFRAQIRGVFLSYSLRCPGSSSPWHRLHPRTIQSGG